MLPIDCKSQEVPLHARLSVYAEHVRVRGFSHVIKSRLNEIGSSPLHLLVVVQISSLKGFVRIVEDEESLLFAVSNGPVAV